MQSEAVKLLTYPPSPRIPVVLARMPQYVVPLTELPREIEE